MANFFPISGGLQILNDSPVDSRFVVDNETGRFSLPSAVVYEGLVSYQKDNNTLYVLEDISEANNETGWEALSSINITDFELNGTTGVLTISLSDDTQDTVTIPIINSGSVTDGIITLTTQEGSDIVLTGDVTGPQGPQGNFRFTIYQNALTSTPPTRPNATDYTLAEDLSTTNGIPSGWSLNPDSPGSGQSTFAITALVDPRNDDPDNDGVVSLVWSNTFVAGSTGPAGATGVSITGATVPTSGDDEGKLVLSRDQGQPNIVTRVIAGDTLGNFQVAAGQLSFDITEGDGTVVPQGPFAVSGISSGDAITVYSTSVLYEQGHLVASVDGSNVSIYRWNDAAAASGVALTDSRWTRVADNTKVNKPGNLASSGFGGHAVFVNDNGDTLDHAGDRVHLSQAGTGVIINAGLDVVGSIDVIQTEAADDSSTVSENVFRVSQSSGNVTIRGVRNADGSYASGGNISIPSGATVDGVDISTLPDALTALADEITAVEIERNNQGQSLEQWEDAGNPASTFVADDAFSLTEVSLANNLTLLANDSYSKMIVATENGDNYHFDLLRFQARGGRLVLQTDNLVTRLANIDTAITEAGMSGGGEISAAASYTQTNVTYGVDAAGDPTLVFQTLNNNEAIGNFVQAAGYPLSEAGSTNVESYTGTFVFTIGTTQYSVSPASGGRFDWNYDTATDGSGSGSLTFDNATSTPAAPGTAVSGTIVANFGEAPIDRIIAGTGTTLTVDGDNNLTIGSEAGSDTTKLNTDLGNVATLTKQQKLSFAIATGDTGIFKWPVLTGDTSHIDDFNAAFAEQVGDFTLVQNTWWEFGNELWEWVSADVNITNSNFANQGPSHTLGGWAPLDYDLWNTLQAHENGDIVSHTWQDNGTQWGIFIRTGGDVAHGGGSRPEPQTTNSGWTRVSGGGSDFNPTEYDPTQVYQTGALVTADGELFQCTATTTAQPGNSTIETEGDNWRSITETLASVDSVATFPLLTPDNSIIRVGEIMCVINDPSPYNNGLYRVISHNAGGTSVARVDELNDLHEIVEGLIQHGGASASFEFPDDNPAFITGTLVDETLFTTVEGTKSTSIPSLDTVGPKFEPQSGRMTLIYSNLSDTQITQLEAAVGSDLAFRTTAGGVVTAGNVEDTDNAVAAQSTYHFLLKSVSYRLGTGRRQLNFVMRDLSQATDFVSAFTFLQNTGLTGNAGNLYIPTDGPLVTNLIDNISLVTIVAISGGGGGFTNGQIVDLGTGSTLNSVAIATTNDVPGDYIKSIDHPTLGQITITEVIGGVEQTPETISTDHVYYRSEYSEAEWGTAGMPANSLGLPGALAFDNTTDATAAVAYRKNSTGSLGTWVILPLAVSSTVVTGWSNPGGSNTNPTLQPTASGQNAVIGKHDGTLTIDDVSFDLTKYTSLLIGVGPSEITTTATGYETDGLSYAHNGTTYYRLFASDGLTEILTTNQNNTDTGDIVYTKTY